MTKIKVRIKIYHVASKVESYPAMDENYAAYSEHIRININNGSTIMIRNLPPPPPLFPLK